MRLRCERVGEKKEKERKKEKKQIRRKLQKMKGKECKNNVN
jgi:hypothetical protein